MAPLLNVGWEGFEEAAPADTIAFVLANPQSGPYRALRCLPWIINPQRLRNPQTPLRLLLLLVVALALFDRILFPRMLPECGGVGARHARGGGGRRRGDPRDMTSPSTGRRSCCAAPVGCSCWEEGRHGEARVAKRWSRRRWHGSSPLSWVPWISPWSWWEAWYLCKPRVAASCSSLIPEVHPVVPLL